MASRNPVSQRGRFLGERVGLEGSLGRTEAGKFEARLGEWARNHPTQAVGRWVRAIEDSFRHPGPSLPPKESMA